MPIYPDAALLQASHTHKTYSWVFSYSPVAGYTYTQEPTLEFPGAALRPNTHTHRTCSRVSWCSCATEYMNIQTGTYSRVSWCSSAAGYTYVCCRLYIHTGTYSSVSLWALLQAIHTPRNLLSGIIVQHCFRLCIMHMYHDKLVCTITFIMLAIIVAIYFIIITQEPTLRYPREALLQALHLHRNLFTGLLVQLCCMLYIHAGTYSGYPGASLLKARYTHGNLLLSIMQLCCMLFLHTRALLLAIYTHRNQRSYLVQLCFR